jgi:HK97 family phage major capsid protein
MLRSTIDSEMTYGLQLAEEAQILFGDGSGQNLHGIVPQATAFSAPFAVEDQNRLDELLLAIAQVQQALLPATGIVLNDLDWFRMLATKDSQGRYIGDGPFGAQIAVAWTLPVSATPSMPAGEFLVGAFADGAQIFDRETVEVLISNEDADNFRKNLVTILAEERLALAVKRPQAFVYGTFSTVT